MTVKQIVLDRNTDGTFSSMTVFHWETELLPVISLFNPPLELPNLIKDIAKAAEKSNKSKPKR